LSQFILDKSQRKIIVYFRNLSLILANHVNSGQYFNFNFIKKIFEYCSLWISVKFYI